MNMRTLLGVAAGLLLAGNLAAPVRAAQGKDLPPGAALYKTKCASCHAKDGKGNPAMAKMFKAAPGALDLVDADTQGRKDEDLTAVIRKGKGKMPAYAAFKDAEVADLTAFLRSLAPPPAKEKK